MRSEEISFEGSKKANGKADAGGGGMPEERLMIRYRQRMMVPLEDRMARSHMSLSQ